MNAHRKNFRDTFIQLNFLSLFFVNFLFFTNKMIAQNNLIHNGSFEDKDEGFESSPCKISQLSNAQVWEDDHKFFYDGIQLETYLNCTNSDAVPCKWYHTPDWIHNSDLSATSNFCHAIERIGPAQIKQAINAHSGEHFVGMYPAELIEQQFFNSNPIVAGKRYTFSMYIRIPDRIAIKSANPANSSWADQPGGGKNFSSISIYLSTQKIEYAFETFDCPADGNPQPFAATNNFKDLTFNQITKIKTFVVDKTNHPIGDWHLVSFDFICPNTSNYDWLAIELDGIGSYYYILIDDVSLVETCELGCYNTSGIPNPIISTPVGYNVPLQITGLDNVEHCLVEVYPLSGQDPIWSADFTYSNGIDVPIYWDGMMPLVGGGVTTVSNGLYICKVTTDNDCGRHTYSKQFFKAVDRIWGPPLPNFPPSTKIEEKVLKECCIYDYQYFNKSFSGTISDKVINDFTVWMNVKYLSGSNSLVIAGHEIAIFNDVEIHENSNFSAFISQCPNAKNMIQTEQNNFVELTNENQGMKKSNIQFKEVKDDLFIVPNPTKGIFSVNIDLGKEGIIEVYDIRGNLVQNVPIEGTKDKYVFDLSNNYSGMYIVRMKTKEDVITKKIILE